MKKLLGLLAFLCLPLCVCFSQGIQNATIIPVSGAPSTCTFNKLYVDTTTNPPASNLYQGKTDGTCRLITGVNATCDASGNCTFAGYLAGSPAYLQATPNSATGTDLGAAAKFVNNAGVVQLQKSGASETKPTFPVIKEWTTFPGTASNCTSSCTTGSASIQGAYTTTVTMGTASVVDNWVKPSTMTGQYDDTGVADTSPCPTGVNCLGYAMTAGTGSQTVVVYPQTGDRVSAMSGAATTAVSAGAALNAAAGTLTCVDGSSQLTTSGCGAGSGIYQLIIGAIATTPTITSAGIFCGIVCGASQVAGTLYVTSGAGTVSEVSCVFGIAPQAGENYTVTVLHGTNFSLTPSAAMTATCAANATTCSTTSGSFSFADHDTLSIKFALTTTSKTGTASCSLKVTGAS